jgi:hypothetical protein
MKKESNSLVGETTIDLLNVKDSTLIGTIGEFIARKYLRDMSGALPRWFGAGQYFYPQYPTLTSRNYEISGLGAPQIEFLKNMSRRYDFIVVKRRRLKYGRVGKVDKIYLVEVKSTIRERRHDMKEGVKMTRKLPKERDIKKAKSLEFTPLLITVNFLDSWKFKVSCSRL